MLACTGLIKQCAPDGDVDLIEKELIGEYNNVAVLMFQQYLEQFPESYSELENTSPQFMVNTMLISINIH